MTINEYLEELRLQGLTGEETLEINIETKERNYSVTPEVCDVGVGKTTTWIDLDLR